MIYYTTISLTPVTGHEAQGIDEAIAQGLNDLNEEAGVPVILTDVIPVVIPGDKPIVCITILAKPLELDESNGRVKKVYSPEEIEEMLKPYMGEI